MLLAVAFSPVFSSTTLRSQKVRSVAPGNGDGLVEEGEKLYGEKAIIKTIESIIV